MFHNTPYSITDNMESGMMDTSLELQLDDLFSTFTNPHQHIETCNTSEPQAQVVHAVQSIDVPPLSTFIINPFEFIPHPPVKSKNTNTQHIQLMDFSLTEYIKYGNDVAIAQHAYVMFGEAADDNSVSSRDLDRNKDIALILKMIGFIYSIPLHDIYQKLASIANANCVLCSTKRPQRGSLICYHCATKNQMSFAALAFMYIQKHSIMFPHM